MCLMVMHLESCCGMTIHRQAPCCGRFDFKGQLVLQFAHQASGDTRTRVKTKFLLFFFSLFSCFPCQYGIFCGSALLALLFTTTGSLRFIGNWWTRWTFMWPFPWSLKFCLSVWNFRDLVEMNSESKGERMCLW